MGKRLDTGQWVYGSLVQMLVDGRVASCIATVKEVCRANKDVPPMGILFTLNKDIFLVDPDTVGPYTGAIGKIHAEPSEKLEEAAKENLPNAPYSVKQDNLGGHVGVYGQCQMLDMFKSGANWQKENLIDKACEWLRYCIDTNDDVKMIDGEPEVNSLIQKNLHRIEVTNQIVAEFKKAMEDK